MQIATPIPSRKVLALECGSVASAYAKSEHKPDPSSRKLPKSFADVMPVVESVLAKGTDSKVWHAGPWGKARNV